MEWPSVSWIWGGFGDLESWASGVLGFVSRTWGLLGFLKPRAFRLGLLLRSKGLESRLHCSGPPPWPFNGALMVFNSGY